VTPVNEKQWLTSRDPGALEYHLGSQLSDRKSRLHRCACCRHIWRFFTDPQSKSAVEIAERYVEGLASETKLVKAHRSILALARANSVRRSEITPYPAALASESGNSILRVGETAALHSDGELAPYCDFLRCIFGNPFQPVSFDPEWLTSTVVALARGIYDERAFDRLPILADSLQDAGCEDTAILDHCRGPGPHARGCWVVDLVLGKE
jgi:hypothetical protein